MTLALSIFFILSACKAQAPSPAPGLISVTESRHLVKKGDLTIIDVRTPQEIAQGIIDGAVSINIHGDNFTQKIGELDTAGTYLIYCKKGSRSARALNMMNKMGFKKVYDLEGGYDNWLTTK